MKKSSIEVAKSKWMSKEDAPYNIKINAIKNLEEN